MLRVIVFAAVLLVGWSLLSDDVAAPALPQPGALTVGVSPAQTGWATFVTLDVDADHVDAMRTMTGSR